MKILVANLGSTSFKYRLFDVSDPAEPVLARGHRVHRQSDGSVVVKSTRGERQMDRPIADHGDAVQLCLDQLADPEIGVLSDPGDVTAIGFKAVHARNLTGVHRVDDHVLEAMEAFADVAPAHNPPYTKAMRMLRDRFPKLPLVAAFETGFHRTIPEAHQRYAIPEAWTSWASGAGGSTAPAIATSPGACPSCWAAPTSRSSRATWAAARRWRPFATASPSRAVWA